MKEYILKTNRLGLRNWILNDVKPFSEMCQDEEIMKYLPNALSEKESLNFIERMQTHFNDYGFCYFAVDILETGEFIGFTGMLHQNFESHFTPCVDIGWRLKKESWGNGYATEAAKACLEFASERLELGEIFSIATLANTNSIAVMKKIGMNYHSTFQHPALLHNDFLKGCAVYYKKFDN